MADSQQQQQQQQYNSIPVVSYISLCVCVKIVQLLLL